MITRVFLSLLVLFVAGCSYRPDVTLSQSVALTIKTPDIRISDVGFFRANDNYINVQVFTAGTLALDLQIHENICLNGPCFDKLSFNRRFLKDEHYPMIMEEILRGKPIYEKRGLKMTEDGFEQRLHVKAREILYSVNSIEIIYRDKANHVLIKIKKLKGNG